MNSSVFFLLAAILIVGGILFAMISFMRRGPAQLDMDKYRKKWIEIERTLQRSDTRSYQMSVLEADKLLDSAMKECGTSGDTMGERLKTRKNLWSNVNSVWYAHKLRNQIVHESDFKLSYEDARQALAGFKRALKDVGAI